MKLSKIIKEQEERQTLPMDVKKNFLEQIKNYNSFRNKLKTEADLVKISEELSELAQLAERITLEETDDWFDKVTINRNMKELKKINGDFVKTAKEAKSVQERMLSLYEDMGHILGRYFKTEMEDTDVVLNRGEGPIISDSTEIKSGTKFNHNGISWVVIKPGATQSRAKAITKSVAGRQDVFDNKWILKQYVDESKKKK